MRRPIVIAAIAALAIAGCGGESGVAETPPAEPTTSAIVVTTIEPPAALTTTTHPPRSTRATTTTRSTTTTTTTTFELPSTTPWRTIPPPDLTEDVGDLPFLLPPSLPPGASYEDPEIDTEAFGELTVFTQGGATFGIAIVTTDTPAFPAGGDTILVDGIERNVVRQGGDISQASWNEGDTHVSLLLSDPVTQDVLEAFLHRVSVTGDHVTFDDGDGFTGASAGSLVPSWSYTISTDDFDVYVTAIAAEEDSLDTLIGLYTFFQEGATVTPTTIRGRSARLVSGGDEGDEDTALLWWESGAVFTVDSFDVGEDVLRLIAGSLEPVDQATWAATLTA